MVELKCKKIQLDPRTIVDVSLDDNEVLHEYIIYVFIMRTNDNNIDYLHGVITKEHFQDKNYTHAHSRYDELVSLWSALAKIS